MRARKAPVQTAKQVNQPTNLTNNNGNNTKQSLPGKRMQRITSALLRQLNKSKWNHAAEPTLYKSVNDYHDNMLAEYVYGIFHPDVVYRDNLTIKAPSIVPIPTSTFAFKETYFTKPNEQGNIAFCWNPNYLGSNQEIQALVDSNVNPLRSGFFSCLYENNHESLTGNGVNTNWHAVTYRRINQDFSKYRLTSACLKIKYIGKVLNQSGQFSACASFMEFPRTACTLQNDINIPSTYPLHQFAHPQLDALGDFDVIRQGQWAKSVSIVQQPDGITVVWLPVDSLSSVFVDNADTIDTKELTTVYPEGMTQAVWKCKNANMTFDLCGFGISSESNINTICVEAYYNYEILVREEQMPYFRPTVIDTKLAAQVEKYAPALKQISSVAGTITPTKSHEAPTTMSRIRDALKEGYKFAEPYLPLIKLAATLI